MSKLEKFKKHEINKSNVTVGGGINTTYSGAGEGGTGNYQDTWYLFKKNNETTVTLDGSPAGHTDYSFNPVN